MIDPIILSRAAELKKIADASYKVFKTKPTIENASTWTNANRTFNDFCVTIIKDLLDEDKTNKKEEILANIEEYKTCNTCGAEVLHQLDDTSYITNINFLDDFPGWCFDCLLTHCTSTDCDSCEINPNTLANTCPFSEVKRLYLEA
jgi:hypothetical protein